MPKKVSLKDIVKAIDKVLAELDGPKGAKRTKRTKTADDNTERTKKILRGMRESVEGICFPVMDVPEP